MSRKKGCFTSGSRRSTSMERIFGAWALRIRRVESSTGLTISESRESRTGREKGEEEQYHSEDFVP